MKVYGNFKQKELSGDFGMGLYEGQISSYLSTINNLQMQISAMGIKYRSNPCESYLRFGSRLYTHGSVVCNTFRSLQAQLKSAQSSYDSYVTKETAWQEEERLLLQKSTHAAVEEAEHIEELQMTIDHLNSQLRANKNMNISLSEQNTQMVNQVNTYKDRVGQLEKQNSILMDEQKLLTSERNSLISERDSLKTVIESQLGPQEQKTSIAKKLLVIGGLATAGYVGYQMMGE